MLGTHASNVSGVAVFPLAVLVTSSDLTDAGKAIGVAGVGSSIVGVLVAESAVSSLTTLTDVDTVAGVAVLSANTGVVNKTLANKMDAVNKLDF